MGLIIYISIIYIFQINFTLRFLFLILFSLSHNPSSFLSLSLSESFITYTWPLTLSLQSVLFSNLHWYLWIIEYAGIEEWLSEAAICHYWFWHTGKNRLHLNSYCGSKQMVVSMYSERKRKGNAMSRPQSNLPQTISTTRV